MSTISQNVCSESAVGLLGIGIALGIVIGIFIAQFSGRKKLYNLDRDRERSTSSDKKVYTGMAQVNKTEPFQILDGALELFRQMWIDPLSKMNSQKEKVVEYLPAEEMLRDFFHNDNIEEKRARENPSFSLRKSIITHKKYHSNPKEVMKLFELIQKYSVNTSHTYFFNQLFGATDPVALAAELVSLSMNTSAYTYETAPIFTMIEKEVISTVAKIVYGEEKSTSCDGIMVPGGSISNLNALHVARQHFIAKMRKSTTVCSFEQQFDQNEDDEKKTRDMDRNFTSDWLDPEPELVAFISEEAHYSFVKAAAVIGLKNENIIKIPTLANGIMDTKYLDTAIHVAKAQYKYPFFVGVTAGSTVRGSFDSIEEILSTCNINGGGIWVHVDGAWGGPAIFSQRSEIRNLLSGVDRADSFTFNPHKMLGAPQQTTIFVSRHKNILKQSNSLQAKYLFDNRKNGASFDIGDALFTCGRRTDAVKFWAMLKFYGMSALGDQVDKKADALKEFASKIQQHDNFILACEPWPFNVNFFYIPKRIKKMLDLERVPLNINNPILPDYISNELAKITVKLKLLLHEAGEMLIPYQPISNQKADCFRMVLAGQKDFCSNDADHILSVMEKYGSDL